MAYIFGVFNSTVSKMVRKWNDSYTKDFPESVKIFVLVDVSNPKYIYQKISPEKL